MHFNSLTQVGRRAPMIWLQVTLSGRLDADAIRPQFDGGARNDANFRIGPAVDQHRRAADHTQADHAVGHIDGRVFQRDARIGKMDRALRAASERERRALDHARHAHGLPLAVARDGCEREAHGYQ